MTAAATMRDRQRFSLHASKRTQVGHHVVDFLLAENGPVRRASAMACRSGCSLQLVLQERAKVALVVAQLNGDIVFVQPDAGDGLAGFRGDPHGAVADRAHRRRASAAIPRDSPGCAAGPRPLRSGPEGSALAADRMARGASALALIDGSSPRRHRPRLLARFAGCRVSSRRQPSSTLRRRWRGRRAFRFRVFRCGWCRTEFASEPPRRYRPVVRSAPRPPSPRAPWQ